MPSHQPPRSGAFTRPGRRVVGLMAVVMSCVWFGAPVGAPAVRPYRPSPSIGPTSAAPVSRASVVGFFRLFSPVPRESRSLAIVAAACLHLPHVSMGDLSPSGALFGALALRLRAPASGAGAGRWLLGHPPSGAFAFPRSVWGFQGSAARLRCCPRRADGLHYPPIAICPSIGGFAALQRRGAVYTRETAFRRFPSSKAFFRSFSLQAVFSTFPPQLQASNSCAIIRAYRRGSLRLWK